MPREKQFWRLTYTLKFNIAPKNRQSSSSKHHFSGSMLNFGGVDPENSGLVQMIFLFFGGGGLSYSQVQPPFIFRGVWIDGTSDWSFDLLTPSWKKRFFFHIQQPQPDVKASTFSKKTKKKLACPPAQDAIVTTRNIFLGGDLKPKPLICHWHPGRGDNPKDQGKYWPLFYTPRALSPPSSPAQRWK